MLRQVVFLAAVISMLFAGAALASGDQPTKNVGQKAKKELTLARVDCGASGYYCDDGNKCCYDGSQYFCCPESHTCCTNPTTCCPSGSYCCNTGCCY